MLENVICVYEQEGFLILNPWSWTVLNFCRLPYMGLVSGKLGEWKSREIIFLTGRLAARRGTSLVVEWLRLRVSNAGGMGLIPGGELRSPMPCGQEKKKRGGGRESESETKQRGRQTEGINARTQEGACVSMPLSLFIVINQIK